MPSFSQSSLQQLKTCDRKLQTLFTEVVKHFDCTVVCGFRNEAEQNKAFLEGKSKKKWPEGKHNSIPSNAVDVVPFPIDWGDTNRMRYFAGFVVGLATSMGIKIRWGGDWNGDTKTKDNSFNDLPHFELG